MNMNIGHLLFVDFLLYSRSLVIRSTYLYNTVTILVPYGTVLFF